MAEPEVKNKPLGLFFQSTSFLMAIQIVFRIFTFITNAVILHYISADLLGVINVRLTLLYSTSTFIGWEAFRRAILSTHSRDKWRHAINLSWMCVPVSAVVSGLLAWVWLRLLSVPDTAVTDEYTLGVWATVLHVCLESLVQPAAILAQAMLFFKLKLCAEVSMQCCRVLLRAALIIHWPGHAVWAYSVSHTVGGLLQALVYYGGLARCLHSTADSQLPISSIHQLRFSRTPGQSVFDKQQVSLTWSFFRQGVLKQVLTEGERYLMTVFQLLTFAEQGVYDVVANLGGLAARLLFQPVEENAYLYFSRTLKRGEMVSASCASVLHQLLRALCLLGACVALFGCSYSHLLLRLYGGELLAAGPALALLRAHCLYVPLLAINGILECFTFAAMLEKQVDRYNRLMVVLSVVFLTAAWLFTRLLGGVGFIIANCINMICRIVICYRYIGGLTLSAGSVEPLTAMRAPPALLCCLLAAGAVTAVSEASLYQQSVAAHLTVGLTCGVSLLVVLWRREHELRYTLLSVVRKRDKTL